MSKELERLRTAVVAAEDAQEQLRRQRALVAELEEAAAALAFRIEERREVIRRVAGPGVGAAIRRTFLVGDGNVESEREALATDENDHARALAKLVEARERLSQLASSAPDVKALRARLEDELRAEVARSDGRDAGLAARVWSLDLRRALRAANAVDHTASAVLAALADLPVFGDGHVADARTRSRMKRSTLPRLETARLRLRDLARTLNELRAHPPAAAFGEGVETLVLWDDSKEAQRAARASVERVQFDVRGLIRDIERLLRTVDAPLG